MARGIFGEMGLRAPASTPARPPRQSPRALPGDQTPGLPPEVSPAAFPPSRSSSSANFATEKGGEAMAGAELRACFAVLDAMKRRGLHFDPQTARVYEWLRGRFGAA